MRTRMGTKRRALGCLLHVPTLIAMIVLAGGAGTYHANYHLVPGLSPTLTIGSDSLTTSQVQFGGRISGAWPNPSVGALAVGQVDLLAPGYYNVTFKESGLSNGTQWWVSLGQSTEYSEKSSMVFQEPNGSYPFIVGPVMGYMLVQPASGTLHVAGSQLSHTLSFAAIATFAVTFVESGLPKGTLWSVNLNGTMSYSTINSLTVPVQNGTYPFDIQSVLSYSANPSAGSVSVHGAGVTKLVMFTTPTVLGLAPAQGFFVVTIGIIGALLLLGAMILILRRRLRRGGLVDSPAPRTGSTRIGGTPPPLDLPPPRSPGA